MRTAISAAVIVAVLAYAGLSGLWVSSNSSWYLSLSQPPWQPPSWVFGLIWPYNFLMLGIVSVRFVQSASIERVWLWTTALVVSVAFAIAWSYSFYQLKNLGQAAAFLVVASLLTLVLTVLVFQFNAVTTLFFVPYQLWLLTAASLAIGYWRLNPS